MAWLAMSEPGGSPKAKRQGESNGGGGSRTRVRKYLPEGIYMRIRFFFLMASVRKRLKTVGHQTRCFSRLDAEPPSNRQPV